jgi:hypothetical protein
MSSIQSLSDSRVPLDVYFGDRVLDAGIATIPKIFLRFYRYLVADGQRLNDRQAMILTLILTLRQDQDFELRVSNLPTVSGPSKVEKDKADFRRMGLVFTSRLYYPTRPNQPPVLRAQRWDFRSLFSNLGQIWNIWALRQQQFITEWQAHGRRGSKPVYTFSLDFAHEVNLPLDVAADIVAEKFFPVPDKWLAVARQMLPTSPNCRGTELPTETDRRGRSQPTATIHPDHLMVVDVAKQHEKDNMPGEVPEGLKPIAELYEQAGHELRPAALLRLRLMAEECHEAAQTYGSTGTSWLLSAMKCGLGVADDLLAYTAGVLKNWITHGPDVDPRPTREGYRPLTYSKVANTTTTMAAYGRDWDND